MASIFEPTTQQKDLMRMVEDGDITAEDASDTFECMDSELNDKINDYLYVRRDMQLTSDNLKSEIDRLTELKKRKDNQIKNLTTRLRNNLEAIDKTKFDTGVFNGHFRKGSKSLKVLDANKVPDEYIKTTITEKVDATQLKKDIESGAVKCDGVEIVIGEPSLIIK